MYTGAMLTANDCEDCAIVGAVDGVVAGVSSGMQLASAIAIERDTGRERYQRPI
jgi:hypothetical protein